MADKLMHNAKTLSEALVLFCTQVIEGKSAGRVLATLAVAEINKGTLLPVLRDGLTGDPVVDEASGKVQYRKIVYGADIFDAIMERFKILEEAKAFTEEKELQLNDLKRTVQTAARYAMPELGIEEYNAKVPPTKFSLNFSDSPVVWAKVIASKLAGTDGVDAAQALKDLSKECSDQAKVLDSVKETVEA